VYRTLSARLLGATDTILGAVNVQPPDPPGFRISDADREHAAQRLHKALVEGRITVSELEERLDVVYAARYEAELRPPLADLPSDGPQVALTPAVPPLVLKAGMSSIRRAGAWQVPARIRVLSGVGSVLLDFCDADNPNPVVEVELEMGAGSAKLLVPDDATVNVDNLVPGMGSVRSAVPSAPQPGHPHFVVHGRTAMGSVRVRRRRRLGRYFR
jgi:Domain of unknown function (DUF1707)